MGSRTLALGLLLLGSLRAHAVRGQAESAQDGRRFAFGRPDAPLLRLPTAQAKAAFRAFNRRHADRWALRYDRRTGAPASLRGARSRPYPGSPEQAAREFFRETRDFMRVDPERLSLRFDRPRGGLHHLWFDQSWKGLPVENGRVAVHLTERGEVLHVDSSFEPDPAVETTPSVPEFRARDRAASDLPGARIDPGSLVLLPLDGALRLAWKVQAHAREPLGRWNYYVDAHSGELLLRFNELRFACGACPTPSAVNGTAAALVYDIDPATTPAAARGLPGLEIGVGASATAVTDECGCFASSGGGRIHVGLEGAHAVVRRWAGVSTHHDNITSASKWQTNSAITHSTPHPYPNDFTQELTVSIPGGGSIVRVIPHFSRFAVGSISSSGEAIDIGDFVRVKTPGGTHVATLAGDNGVPAGASLFGPTVRGSGYKLLLETDSAGQSYGYDVDFSSYLTVSGGNVFNSSFLLTSTHSSNGSVNEANLFYHLGQFALFLDDQFFQNAHAGFSSSFRTAVPVTDQFGPNLANAFYDPLTRSLYFGDVGEIVNQTDPIFDARAKGAFSTDGTVVKHEYVHAFMDMIYPLFYFGQAGALGEAFADYFSGSLWDPAVAPAGIPGIAAYAGLLLSDGQTFPGEYVPIRTMKPKNGPGTAQPSGPCQFSKQHCFLSFPQDWTGEVHDDGQILAQAMWLLRLGGDMNQSNFQLDLDPFLVRQSDRLLFESLFFYPQSFVGLLEALFTLSDPSGLGANWGFTVTHVDRIRGAFASHGISTTTLLGDGFEPNDENGHATDFYSNAPVTATVFPAGDVDVYAIPAGPGPLSATLGLPATGTGGTSFAYQVTLTDADMNELATGDPPYDVNPSGSGFCQDTGNCLTTASSVQLAAEIAQPGVYYLWVSGGENDFFSNSPTSSETPYTLEAQSVAPDSLTGSVVNASFDQDRISYEVFVSSYLANLYVYSHAQLRDHALTRLGDTRTDAGGSFLQNFSGPTVTGNKISGEVRIQSGFNARYPAVGEVHLEVFGTPQGIPGQPTGGPAVSLGVSGPLTLAGQGASFKAWNNVLQPGQGGKVTFRFDLGAPGRVTLKLYSMDGTVVRTLIDEVLPAGQHARDWTALNDLGNVVGSGVYVARLATPGSVSTQKVVVVK